MVNKKKYKKYCNENYLRFNLDNDRTWQLFIKEFGEERTDKLNQLFADRFDNPEKGNPYSFCENFRESSCLMYFQSDFFYENSIKLLETVESLKPRKTLELGCYNGILLNYLAELYTGEKFIGIDVEEKIVGFANERFKRDNLDFLTLDYKDIFTLNNKFDFIFTLFGVESIPSGIKSDTYKIRNNTSYLAIHKYFDNFFKYLKPVVEDKSNFLPLIRIKDLEDLLAFLDAGKKNNWSLKDNKIDFVKSGNIHRMNERIPSFLLEYDTEGNSEEINLDNFFEITKEYRDEDNLRDVYSYQKNKSKFTDKIKEDSIYYEDDGNTMRYEIYKNLGIFMMFLWSTNGFSIYREFDNKNDLEESFTLYTKRYLDF
jgi:SAM-dependent methyltransferase